jgi:SAM-dependent methyltransferase
MSESDFDTYFDRRASRFAAFYRSEPVAWLLGRGPLFQRMRGAVQAAETLKVHKVLDVGCGSGPLFEPLATRGITVVGIDPAPAMVQLAEAEAQRFPGKVKVQQRGWEDINESNAYDMAVALGVFDYVEKPTELLTKMGRAATYVVASFPSPGLRLQLRRVRYGMRGVGVHGYDRNDLVLLARNSGLEIVELSPLGRAGHLAAFRRPEAGSAGPGTTPTAR